MMQGELHILPTDVMPTYPIFTEKTGPLDGPTRRKRLSNPGRTDLLEVSGNATCLKMVTTTTLSILILSKAYPTLGILSPLSRHAKLFGSGVCFAERLLLMNPFNILAQFKFIKCQLDLPDI